MISAFNNFLTFFLTGKSSDFNLRLVNLPALNLSRFIPRTKTGLLMNDVTLVTAAFVANTLAFVLAAAQSFVADFIAAHGVAAFDGFLCFATGTCSERR